MVDSMSMVDSIETNILRDLPANVWLGMGIDRLSCSSNGYFAKELLSLINREEFGTYEPQDLGIGLTQFRMGQPTKGNTSSVSSRFIGRGVVIGFRIAALLLLSDCRSDEVQAALRVYTDNWPSLEKSRHECASLNSIAALIHLSSSKFLGSKVFWAESIVGKTSCGR